MLSLLVQYFKIANILFLNKDKRENVIKLKNMIMIPIINFHIRKCFNLKITSNVRPDANQFAVNK